MDTIDIFGVVCVLNKIFLFVPLLLYSLYQFYLIRNKDVMAHRKQKIVYLMNALSITALLFEQPFLTAVNVWKIHRKPYILKWILILTENLCICCIFSLFLCKLWLLYFKKQYHASLASQTWERQINSRFNSWYVLNKNKWGNDKFILKVSQITLLIFLFIEIMVEHYLLSDVINMHFSILFLSLIYCIPSFILYLKLKHFYDIFNIAKEILYQIVIMCIFLIIYATDCVIELIWHYNESHDEIQHSRINALISISTASSALFFMSILSTAYPVYLHKTLFSEIILTRYVRSKSGTSTSTSSRSKKRKLKIEIKGMLNVIANYKGFQAFMMHLVEECSTENLFFILELIQMKHEFQMKHNRVLKLPKTMDIDNLTPIGMTPVPLTQIPSLSAISNPTPPKLTPYPSTSAISEFHTIDFNVGDNDINKSKDIQNSSTFQMIAASSYIFTNKGKIFCHIKLPVGIPRSELIYLNKHSFKDQLFELYLKYIKVGSIHEINICYKQRCLITQYFKDYVKSPNIQKNMDDFNDLTKIPKSPQPPDNDKKTDIKIDAVYHQKHDESESEDMTIYKLMDGACIEIVRLMLNSYSRFIQTKTGQKIIDHICNNKLMHNNHKRAVEHDVIHTDSSYSVLQKQYQFMSQIKK